MAIDSSKRLRRFLPSLLKYDANPWYIANRGLSDHEATENVTGKGTRGASVPKMSAIGEYKCKLASLAFSLQ